MPNPTLTTKLEAINSMLSAIGQAAVTSLGDGADATMAEQIFDEINIEVQNEGWKFNTHVADLTADAGGHVDLDTYVARADVPRKSLSSGTTSKPKDIVMLGDPADSDKMKLYDLTNNTFAVTSANGTVKDVELVYLMDYILLPETARNYIKIKATRQFQDRMVGSTKHGRYTREDELRARARMMREQSETGDHNVLRTFVGKIMARPSPLDKY